MEALGPKRPIRRPKPLEIEFVGENFAYLDATSNFQAGDEIFVCVQEEPALFELLESGVYTTINNENVTVIDGVIDEIV